MNILSAIDRRIKMMWVKCSDERRAISTINSALNLKYDGDYTLYEWSFVSGLSWVNGLSVEDRKPDLSVSNFMTLLNKVDSDRSGQTYYILKTTKEIHSDYRFIRKLRDIYESNDSELPVIIFLTNDAIIPDDISRLVFDVEMTEIGEDSIEILLKFLSQDKYEKLMDTNPSELEKESLSLEELSNNIKEIKENVSYYSQFFLGMGSKQISDVFNACLTEEYKLDIDMVKGYKIDFINKSGLLDYIDETLTLDDIGGNHNFKEWVNEIKYIMTPKAREYNIPESKGYLALGVPGTSKTLSAKVVAGELGLPLIKYSPSKVLSNLYGDSEKNIRNAMDLVQSMAPCVLLIDEIEKTLSGLGSSNSTDSGTTSRVFSTILESLNDFEGVFTVMTSNDISQLPPELTRAGRLDTIWYFSLPNEEEREEIFKIHLNKQGISLDKELLNSAIKNTENYTGSEIETLCGFLKRKAFRNMVKEDLDELIYTESLVNESIEDVVPVYRLYKEKINAIEYIASKRARKASKEKEDFDDNYDKFIIS